MKTTTPMINYAGALADALHTQDWSGVGQLVTLLRKVRRSRHTVYVCGNGGSAANATHWANDMVYPLAKTGAKPLRCVALTANTATLTCLANDLSYEEVFSFSLKAAAEKGDVLIALSGSGNSPNILRVLKTARSLGVKSCAITGFDGGKAKSLADIAIHFPVHDMQMAEDLQVVACHMVMRELCQSA